MNIVEAKQIISEALNNKSSILNLSSLAEPNKLSDSDISEILPDFFRLENLEWLNLSGNQLTTVDSKIASLRNLQVLDLSKNQLTVFDKVFCRLEKLEWLYLNGNQLTTFDKEFANLRSLTKLDLSSNQLSKFDEEFARLDNLQVLSLSLNQLSNFDKEFAKLGNLQRLSLSGNQITVFDKRFTELKNLQQLDLRDNPLPFALEILDAWQNPNKILNFISDYYEAQEKGKLRPLNEAKLVIVGEANVGKTCVINRLIRNEFVKTESTHGIRIHRWENVELENKEKVQLNVWDFGGQEIMHSTHQFFFTKRTIYILVINARENQDNNITEEWLQRIKNLSQDSPVFIVGNKIDENNRGTDRTSLGYFDIDRTNLTNKFPELIKGFYGISSDVRQLQYDFLFEDFKKDLILKIGELEEIHKEFPENWFDIKLQLEQMRDKKIPYISFQNYISRCLKVGIEKEESQRTLIEFMHDLGIALSFQDDRELRDLAVLNPEWVTRGVYALIDNAQITLEKGILKREMIGRYLNEDEYPPGEEQDFIIKMMRKFRLLVEIEKDKTFLIPDLLPKDEPDTGNWDNALHFQYGYEIYEKSILRSFIVEMYSFWSKETYWRNGIVLKRGDNRALVKADALKREVTVKIEGNPNTRREFLAIIRRSFDMIHGRFDSLTIKEKVGHPTLKIINENGLKKTEEIFEDYKKMLNMEEDGETEIYVNNLRRKLPIKEFLDGVESAEVRLNNREKRRSEKEASSTLTANVEDNSSALIENKKTEIENLEKEIARVDSRIVDIDEEARTISRFKAFLKYSLIFLPVVAFVGLVFYLGWNTMEVWTWFAGVIGFLCFLGIACWKLNDYTPLLPSKIYDDEKNRLYTRFGIDLRGHKFNQDILRSRRYELKEMERGQTVG